MSKQKKFFGYFLIFLSLMMVGIIGLPQIYSSTSSGKIDKNEVIQFDFLKEEKADIVLIYCGYVGCDTICVPSLTELSSMYKSLDHTKIKVYFLNLLKIIDPDLPNLFATSFDKTFKGIYLNDKQLQRVTKQLNLVYTRSLTDKYELNHSGYLYVLVKDKDRYRLKYIYTTRPFNQKLIIKDLNNLLK